MAKTTRHDIVIVGDGLTGLTMALALARENMPCALVGPTLQAAQKKNRADGRTTAIMQDGIDFLDGLGVWSALKKEAAPLKHMRLISGERDILFPSTTINLPQFGFNIPNAVLKDVLLQAVKKNKAIATIHGLAEQIAFPDKEARPFATIACAGQTVEASLVIAADGADSKARQAAGIGQVMTDSNQAALVCLVQAERPHDWTSTEWYHSGGPFTLVPTADPNIMAVVYCDTPEIIAHAVQSDRNDLSDLFMQLSNNYFGDLVVASAVQSWPIRPMRAKTLVAPHLALIGEAAHVMPPLAAQGFNTSLRDIQALQKTLQRAASLGLDKAAPIHLQPYADQRALDITLRGTAVNGLNALIRRDDAWGRRVHAFGFAALEKILPLKTALMRVALAPRAKGRSA